MEYYIGFYVENKHLPEELKRILGNPGYDGTYVIHDDNNIVYRCIPLYVSALNRIVISNILGEETFLSTISHGQMYIVFNLSTNIVGNYNNYAAIKVSGLVIPEEVNLKNVPSY